MCGVGNSARFIRKQALNITKLLTVNTPDEFIEQLAVLHFDRPELGIAGPASLSLRRLRQNVRLADAEIERLDSHEN